VLAIYLSIIDTEEEKNQFEHLYTTYKQNMYAIAYDVLKNKEDAEDAVHQSFLKIADNFTKVLQIFCNEIKAYVVIISRNTAIDMYRQNKNRATHTTELNETEIVDESYFENKDYDGLLKAIEQLPQIYKDVLSTFIICMGFLQKKLQVSLE
jgi:RNA polymerase sigma-70 factor (ECF subfamily)